MCNSTSSLVEPSIGMNSLTPISCRVFSPFGVERQNKKSNSKQETNAICLDSMDLGDRNSETIWGWFSIIFDNYQRSSLGPPMSLLVSLTSAVYKDLLYLLNALGCIHHGCVLGSLMLDLLANGRNNLCLSNGALLVTLTVILRTYVN